MVLEAGFSLDVDEVQDSSFDTLALACPIPDYLNLEDTDLSAIVDKVTGALPTQVITGTNFEEIEMVVNTDPGGLWSVPNDEYTVATEKKVWLRARFTGFSVGDTNPRIAITQDGIIIASFDAKGVFTNRLLQVEATTVGSTAFAVKGYAQDDGSLLNELHISACEFKLDTVSTAEDREMIISSRLPEIDQDKVLVGIMKMLNLGVITDTSSNTVKLFSWENVYTNEAQDLTARYMDNLKSTIKNESGYFRSNLFEFAGSKEVWANTNRLLDDKRLKKEGVIIKSEFEAPGQGGLFPSGGRINAYKGEIITPNGTISVTSAGNSFTFSDSNTIKKGDWLSVGNDTRRIATVTSDTTGTITGTWTATNAAIGYNIIQFSDNVINPTIVNIVGLDVPEGRITQGALNVTTYLGTKAALLDPDTIFAGLINSNYALMLGSLNNYMMLEAWFSLTEQDFNEIDLERPVYLANYNAHFFISKLEQWRPNKPTRLQLFRL